MRSKGDWYNPVSINDRLRSNMQIDEKNGCWNWQRAINKGGYGTICYMANRWFVHRLCYEMFRGPIPEGYEVDHLCRNRRCLNPDHLEPVTKLENIRRGAAAVTHCAKGHPYDEENTYLRSYRLTNHRTCRACRRDGMTVIRNRKKLASKESV